MKRYRILDVESIKDFADGFQNSIQTFVRNEGEYIVLDTYDGELMFTKDEVEEIE